MHVKSYPRGLPSPEGHPTKPRRGLKEGARGPQRLVKPQVIHQTPRIVEKPIGFWWFSLKLCKKYCFFNAKPFMRRPKTPPQGGAKIGTRILKLAPRSSESLIFHKLAALKCRCSKGWKNEKVFWKKWNLHHSRTIRAPRSASLKKGCLEHSK